MLDRITALTAGAGLRLRVSAMRATGTSAWQPQLLAVWRLSGHRREAHWLSALPTASCASRACDPQLIRMAGALALRPRHRQDEDVPPPGAV